ncbi:MAG: C13 family peptidase [Myxococcota bacterium]
MSTTRRGPGLALVGLALLFAAACRPPAPAPPEEPPVATTVDAFADLPYASAPLPATTKVLLVAGGDDVANFAADVLEQRALWIEAGLRDDEIACYYAKPTLEAQREDHEQYEQLRAALAPCYSADPATLHEHLRQVARQAPPFLYLFISSHGLPPLLRWKAGVDDANRLPARLDLQPGEIGRFDHHAIGLEGGSGPGLGQVTPMLEAHRSGTPTEQLVLTPSTLADALTELPESSDAIIVLQACFSGGFIGRPDDGPSPLTERPRTTILTASSPLRPSFGCGSGSARTYYGGAFNRVLAQVLEHNPTPRPLTPAAMPWASIYEQVRFVVETMERIDGETPSQPALFSNVPGSETQAPQ